MFTAMFTNILDRGISSRLIINRGMLEIQKWVRSPHVCICGFYGGPTPIHAVVAATDPGNTRARFPGPLMDRIDIHIEVPAVRYRDLRENMPVNHPVSSRVESNQPDSVRIRDSLDKKTLCNARMSDRQIRITLSLTKILSDSWKWR